MIPFVGRLLEKDCMYAKKFDTISSINPTTLNFLYDKSALVVAAPRRAVNPTKVGVF